MKDLRNYNLLSHNTFGIDVECKRFVSFETTEEVHSFIANRTDTDLPTLVIGEGSNLLFTQKALKQRLVQKVFWCVVAQESIGMMW